MDEQKPKTPPEVEQLLVELARTYNWISMYQENHPSLAKRIETMHRALTDRINREPSGHLFFGIAKDKVLYRDVFLGCGQHLVHRFTECLFLQQVATLDFSAEISPKDLLAFLRGMHRSSLEKTGEPLESLLRRAYAASEAGLNFATSPHPGTEIVSPELVQKLLGRLGGTIGKLPDDQKSRILRFLDTGFEEMCGGKESTASLEYLFGQSLTGSQPDNEFLDLLESLSCPEEGLLAASKPVDGPRPHRILHDPAGGCVRRDPLLPAVPEKRRGGEVPFHHETGPRDRLRAGPVRRFHKNDLLISRRAAMKPGRRSPCSGASAPA